jgi:hypothetical protein
METYMPEETLYNGLKQETRGLKDPGNILILVYILLIFFLLLFAGLESARADLDKTGEETFSIDRNRELPVSAWHASSRLDNFRFVGKGLSVI